MTRVASLLSVLLALLLGTGPWISENPTLSIPLSLGVGVLLLISGHGTFRQRKMLHLLLLVTALATLARFLPSLFIHYRYWPDLLIIFFSALVFGFGLIGFVIDRYSAHLEATNRVAQ